jgi:hypothetical protein
LVGMAFAKELVFGERTMKVDLGDDDATSQEGCVRFVDLYASAYEIGWSGVLIRRRHRCTGTACGVEMLVRDRLLRTSAFVDAETERRAGIVTTRKTYGHILFDEISGGFKIGTCGVDAEFADDRYHPLKTPAKDHDLKHRERITGTSTPRPHNEACKARSRQHLRASSKLARSSKTCKKTHHIT